VATGEKEWTLRAFKTLIEAGAVDIVMPDAGKAEGVTGFKKVIDFAPPTASASRRIPGRSAINTAAAAHLFASAANGVVFELKPTPRRCSTNSSPSRSSSATAMSKCGGAGPGDHRQ